MIRCFNPRCSAKITVRIRHIDQENIWKAKDKKRAKFPTIITIQGLHNHQVVNADALKELRVLPKIKELFFTYFDLGKNHISILPYNQVLSFKLFVRVSKHISVCLSVCYLRFCDLIS